MNSSKGFSLSLSILLRSLFLISFCCGVVSATAQNRGDILTNAADVLSLTAEQAARRISVSVTGIVTAAEPDWEGRFFVQDSSGGVFVDSLGNRQPAPGDVVEVHGHSHPGAFAPIISNPHWKKSGTAPLPLPKQVSIDQLMAGIEDSQRVEITGLVQAARIEKPRLALDLVSGGYRLHVFTRIPSFDPQSLIGARVRVRGTAAASFKAPLRQLITVKMYVPTPEDFIVETPEGMNPFDSPSMPLNSVAQYRRDQTVGKRVHVKGILTHQRLGEDLFLQDKTGGLRVRSRQLTAFAPGDVIEAVGFPGLENYLPVLQDAVCRKTSEALPEVEALPVTLSDLRSGLHHAKLISMKGKLIDRTVRQVRRHSTDPEVSRTMLVLQSTDFTLTAEHEDASPDTALNAIPLGSTVEVSGVCVTESGEDGKLKSLEVLLPSLRSVRVLEQPGWFTPQRLFIGFAALCAVLFAVMIWTVTVTKKNAVLNFLIREREKAQMELQHAHDLLEQKVKERTAQLKFEITARQEGELQLKGVLTERTRLAQELHDTLEQTLTGIALQLDTASKLFDRDGEQSREHLELARSLMRQSQLELRESIWDLRSRELEEFDLPGALLKSGRQITAPANIRVAAQVKGSPKALSEVVEENLLRIGQEAFANVVKHSAATEVQIQLEFGPSTIILQISDNGRGFAIDHCVGFREGHFGLLGMSERAKRLNGQVIVTSSPGMGTTVRVEIPLRSMPTIIAAPELTDVQP